MTGPCMCGDPYCHSCGPAQGNSKCWNCGKWSIDGGCENPEACQKANRLSEQAEAEECEKEKTFGTMFDHWIDP